MAYTRHGFLDTRFAWVHLVRLGGCNYKQRVTRRGKSVIVPDPQTPGRTYRLDAAKFDAGEFQCRNDWAIVPWSERAKETTHNEQNWQA